MGPADPDPPPLRAVRQPPAGEDPAGCALPLADSGPIDLVVVRENNEGEYSEIGGRMYRGLPEEFAVQESVFTRRGVDRVARYAARLAASRGGRLTSATKSNGIVHTMPFWDEVVRRRSPTSPRSSCEASSSTRSPRAWCCTPAGTT